MKFKQVFGGPLASVAMLLAVATPMSATTVKFSNLEEGFYVVNQTTNQKTELVDEKYGTMTVDLAPATYTLYGYHANDRNETPLSFDFEVLDPESYDNKDNSLSINIGFGYYRISQSVRKEGASSSYSWRGGVDVNVSDIKLYDADGKEVKCTYATYKYTNTSNPDRNDVEPSGYFIMGIQGYTTTATFTPVAELWPEYLPLQHSAELSYSVNSTSLRCYEATNLVFTYPTGAEGNLYIKKNETHYIPFEFIAPTSTADADGITTKSYAVPKDGKSYNYRVSREGSITCAGIFQSDKVQTVNVTEEMLSSYDRHYFNHNVSTKVGNGTKYADIFLNINKRHLLRMEKDQQYQIVNLRTWQLTNSSTANYFIEPDYYWNVYNTDFQPDQSVVKVDENGMLTAVAPGTAIVQVGYDAIRLSAMDGDVWSEIWAENMGTFVVTVDVDADKAPEDNIRLSYKPTYELDAEHDILYYMSDKPGYELTFTPAEGATVDVANPKVDTELNTVSYPAGFSKSNVTANADGSVTVLLTYGRNIIRTIGADGEANFQVLSAKPITCEVVTPRADGYVLPGDDITFQFDGLFHVSGKLAGIYNCNTHVRFNGISTLAGTILGNGQYDFAGNAVAQRFSLTVPVDAADKVEIVDGCLDPEGYGSGPGSHRAVDYTVGMNPNFNAGVSSGEYGSIPTQTAIVTSFDKVDRLLVKTKLGESVTPVRQSVLKQVFGENIGWVVEDVTMAVVNDTWAVCPVKAGKTSMSLYAEGNDKPLLTCDIEIEDVEGYVPVESIKFSHEGDKEIKMDLSWGNWGNASGNKLEVVVEPSDATDKSIRFTSSNPEMVMVGKKGNSEYSSTGSSCSLFWNLNNIPGESVVTAESADGRLKISTVVRYLRYASSVKLDQNELDAEVGRTYQLTATVTPDVCSYPTEWSSSDETVATVDENGVVTAVGEGQATITASVEGRYSASPEKATCAVTVKSASSGIESVEIESDGKARWFNIQGIEVPAPGQGAHGVFIRVSNGKSQKVIF